MQPGVRIARLRTRRPGGTAMTGLTFDALSNGSTEEESRSIETPAPEAPAGITPPRHRGRSSAPLAEVLVELGFTSRQRADAAIEESRRTGTEPERILRTAHAVTADQLTRAVAERLGIDFVDLSVSKADLAAAKHDQRRGRQALRGRTDRLRRGRATADRHGRPRKRPGPRRPEARNRPRGASGHRLRRRHRVGGRPHEPFRRGGRLGARGKEEELPVVPEIRESAEDAPAIRLVASGSRSRSGRSTCAS